MVEAPTHNLTDKQLKWSYWYISNKLKIRRYTTLAALALAVLFWLLFGWQSAGFIMNYNNDQYLINKLLFTGSPYADWLQQARPQGLALSDTQTFLEENGRYDFLASIKNPNSNWLATFDYRFSDGNQAGTYKRGFVMPGEEKYLLDLGHDEGASKLEIANQRWQRVKMSQQIMNTRLLFEVADEKLYAGTAAGEPNRVVFLMSNNSAFGFWNVGAQVLLYSGGQLVSLNYIDIKQFRAGERRQVEVDWNYGLPAIDSIQVIPEVNVFDDGNIMKPGD